MLHATNLNCLKSLRSTVRMRYSYASNSHNAYGWPAISAMPCTEFFCWIELEFSCTIPISYCNSRFTTLCTGNRAQVLGILWLKGTAPLGHPYSRTQMQRRWRWRLHLLHKWQTDVRDIYANWQLLPAGNRAEARPARGGGSINCRRRQWHICVSESST